MGKRSNFDRVERDYYPTPREAVLPLRGQIAAGATFIEPCAGDGRLVRWLTDDMGLGCVWAGDIEPRGSGVTRADYTTVGCEMISTLRPDYIITNPPWSRDVLHQMIEHFSPLRPTWLLFDADWIHTRQSARFMSWLRRVVSIGRVKWIEGSKMTGKENCCWYLFDANSEGETVFVGRQA